MANITEILGTDSISSSRPIINSNFNILKDEIADLKDLVNPVNATIQGITSATVESLSVIDSNTNVASFLATGIDFGVNVKVSGKMTMNGQIIKSGTEGSLSTPTNITTPSSLSKSNYFINTNFTLPAGVEGQEVTIINADSDPHSIAAVAGAGISLGANTIELDGLNSTITLRYLGNVWYVISSHNTTIS